MTDMPTSTPDSQPDPGTAAPERPTPADRGGKLRLFLILGGMVALLAVVLWVVRDNQSADDLAVGTCLDLPGREVNITTVTTRPCAEAHDAEVFHVAEYTGESYPISLSLDSFIEETCVPAFAAYVGTDLDANEDLGVGYFHPSRDGWDNGDRTVTCYAVRQDESKLTQSVKAAGS